MGIHPSSPKIGTETGSFTAYVRWPSAPLTDSLVRNALSQLSPKPEIITSLPEVNKPARLLQWSTYDVLDHDITLFQKPGTKVLTCAYTIRKALIRKHFLSRSTQHYLAKNPNSVLQHGIPKTWEIELSFVDELDEMWSDELYDLGAILEEGKTWMILKPAMASRGMGIRLFHTKEELEAIFLEFEDDEAEEAEENDAMQELEDIGTGVATSQLRHFVIQEYNSNPLLLDPAEVPLGGARKPPLTDLQGHKFHLRVYCVAQGALHVYFYNRFLALFSATPYTSPFRLDSSENPTDISAHLTNTSLQKERGEAGVRLFDELVGSHVLSRSGHTSMEPQRGVDEDAIFTEADATDVKKQIGELLEDSFRAALGMSVHFQPVPNAFELYGVDFLVSHVPVTSHADSSRRFLLSLLEFNSEPAIEMTGPRLTWILEDLFVGIAKTCVTPFFQADSKEATGAQWKVGETKENMTKCWETQVRGADGWNRGMV
ncbi:tubulin-tyrosine ligase family-domain-containing protein [Irpex rosettiformis]|uniref:Tubulin-tyrosine ligase family-domain-containing protein n=1 Tax=Irpex rosettiformis TaxID=378272 RepID=A0ACB8UKN7_9APHY|nr:tubulin-tyrosine ligase family-domain-containing protein [Irpex rosettiformis]